MAIGVVHVLEVVQVHKSHQDTALTALRPRQQPLKFRTQGGAVGQLGERVGQRQLHELGIAFLQGLQQLLAFDVIGHQLGKQLEYVLCISGQGGGACTGCAQGAKNAAIRHAYGGAGIGANAQCPGGLRVAPFLLHLVGPDAPFGQRVLAQGVAPGHGQPLGNVHLLGIVGVQHMLLGLFEVDGGEVGGLQLGDLLQHFQ